MQVKNLIIGIICIILFVLILIIVKPLKNRPIHTTEKLTVIIESCKNKTINFSCSCYGSSKFPVIKVCNLTKGLYLAIVIYDLNTSPRFYHLFMYDIKINSTCMTFDSVTGHLGINSGSMVGYYPFCPPKGSKHYYVIEVFEYKKPIKKRVLDNEYLSVLSNSRVIASARRICVFGVNL